MIILLILIILIIIFLKLYLFYTYYIKNKQNSEYYKNNLSFNKIKIIHLVLYSDDKYYNQMYNITSKYYKKFTNVKTIYYKFYDKTELIDNILTIKGYESYIPGILDKTIKAFDYIKDYEFDYIVRSNISTIINFELLINNLNNNIDYAGGVNLYINDSYRDIYNGIIDDRYKNTYYGSGTSIILSKKIFTHILTNKQYIDYNVIDDVSIGFLIKKILPDIILYNFSDKFLSFNDINIKNNIVTNEIIFYRNRNITRDIDIENMSYIIKILNNK